VGTLHPKARYPSAARVQSLDRPCRCGRRHQCYQDPYPEVNGGLSEINLKPSLLTEALEDAQPPTTPAKHQINLDIV
jgi:hypothetical protein